MLKTLRRVEYAELMTLFFIQGAALSMWLVPLSTVLDAHGLAGIRPYAFAANALAAFVSPLVFGAMADRHASPVAVLRGVSIASACAASLAATAIHLEWNHWLVLATIQLQALCSAPSWSIASAIVLARLADPQREYGRVRGLATLGWMSGCWGVSALGADTSALAGFSSGIVWIVVAAFTCLLPSTSPPRGIENLKLRQRLGLDALQLLRNRDHRVVFMVVALFSIPLAAFYPYAPPHLRELGFSRTSAWMSLGQVTEIIAMFSLGALLSAFRLKWIFAAGLGFGVLRFLLSALDSRAGLVAGVALHGFSFTLVFITAQIYIDQRVPPGWRVRAQALLALMNGGVGNLVGYLGTGWWFSWCDGSSSARWTLFWLGLAGGVVLVLIFFLIAYRGIGSGRAPSRLASEST